MFLVFPWDICCLSRDWPSCPDNKTLSSEIRILSRSKIVFPPTIFELFVFPARTAPQQCAQRVAAVSSCRQKQHSLVQKLFHQKLKKMMLLFLDSPPRCSQEHCCSSQSLKMLQTPWMTNFQNSSDWRLLQGSSL